jgi:hypothetical protein
MNTSQGLLLVVLGLVAGLARAQDGLEPPRATRERGLVFTAPAGWRPAEPLETEREAWVVGDRGARLRVSLLRLKRGKPLDERVARWAAAFEGAAGEPLAPEAARREAIPVPEAEGVTAHLVSLAGAFVGALEPGAEERVRREGWAALLAVLDGPDGTWIASVVGPAADVERCREGVVALIKAVRIGMVEVEPPAPEPAPDATDDPEPDGEEGE